MLDGVKYLNDNMKRIWHFKIFSCIFDKNDYIHSFFKFKENNISNTLKLKNIYICIYIYMYIFIYT